MNVDKEQLQPYLDNDCDIIPLHFWNKQTNRKGKIQQRGKTPLYNDWTSRAKDVKAAKALIKKGHNAGYRLGSEDLVIDVDPRNFPEADNPLERLCDFLDVFDLNEICPTVITGSGGFHYYMSKPEDFNCREIHERFPGIEFKTQGRQVVCAGSKHPNGNMYQWDDFTIDLADKPPAPKQLLKLLKRETPVKQANAGVLTNKELELLLEQLPVEEYKEHDEWFKVLCSSHHATNGNGIEEFLAWSLADADFEDDIHLIKLRWESLADKPASITVNTLYKEVLAHGGNTNTETAESDFADFKSDDDEEGGFSDVDDDFEDIFVEKDLESSYKAGLATKICKDLHSESHEEDIMKAVRAALQAGTIEQMKCFKIIQENLRISKGDLNEIIKQIKEQIAEDLGRILAEKTLEIKFNNGKGLVFNNNGQFWAYNGTHWVTITKQYVGKKVTEVLDKLRERVEVKVKENAIVNEALGIIERLAATSTDALRMREKPYPVINCKNGELWIDDDGTAKLRKHKPSSYLLQCIGVEYTRGAESPLFDKTIREIFSKFADCEDIVRHFEEFMGYVLHPDKRPAHWWLFKGPGGDGKSTLMKILAAMLGEAVLPESIDRFKSGNGGDKHATDELVGKLLVYDDDLNKNTILPDGILKKLSEDGETTANPKGVKGFKFTRVCTVAMLSNGYPKTKDISRGFRRRAMVVPFNMAFHENGAILDLPDQIIKKELAGVMNRALEGLQRLRARGKFLEPKSCYMAKQEWLHESNPVAFFIQERIQLTEIDSDSIALGDLYIEFLDFCNSYNLKRLDSKQQFRSDMEDMGIHYGVGGQNKRVFKGIKLKSVEVDDFDGIEVDF